MSSSLFILGLLSMAVLHSIDLVSVLILRERDSVWCMMDVTHGYTQFLIILEEIFG